jgi:hypothetical protein
VGSGEEESLRFSNERKIRKQMRKRGWTERELREALAAPEHPAQGRRHPARRHVHPVTGRSVLVDAETGEIFHVGGKEFGYDPED